MVFMRSALSVVSVLPGGRRGARGRGRDTGRRQQGPTRPSGPCPPCHPQPARVLTPHAAAGPLARRPTRARSPLCPGRHPCFAHHSARPWNADGGASSSCLKLCFSYSESRPLLMLALASSARLPSSCAGGGDSRGEGRESRAGFGSLGRRRELPQRRTRGVRALPFAWPAARRQDAPRPAPRPRTGRGWPWPGGRTSTAPGRRWSSRPGLAQGAARRGGGGRSGAAGAGRRVVDRPARPGATSRAAAWAASPSGLLRHGCLCPTRMQPRAHPRKARWPARQQRGFRGRAGGRAVPLTGEHLVCDTLAEALQRARGQLDDLPGGRGRGGRGGVGARTRRSRACPARPRHEARAPLPHAACRMPHAACMR
jgi:hypothetical protein